MPNVQVVQPLRYVLRGIGPFQWFQPFNRFAPFQSFEWFDKLTMSGVIFICCAPFKSLRNLGSGQRRT
jgi:hypothetical protein